MTTTEVKLVHIFVRRFAAAHFQMYSDACSTVPHFGVVQAVATCWSCTASVLLNKTIFSSQRGVNASRSASPAWTIVMEWSLA